MISATISDPQLLAALAWARALHNEQARLAQSGGPSPPPTFEDDAGFFQWLAQQQCVALAQQKIHAMVQEALRSATTLDALQRIGNAVAMAQQNQVGDQPTVVEPTL